MKFRATLWLLAFALLLGGFYFIYQLPRAEAKKSAAEFEKRFFRADAAGIVSIKVENREGTVEISHGPQGWLIERPQRYRPDDGMIKKLLETISGGRLTKVVGETADLSQFGFDHPVLSLTLGMAGGEEILVIGQKNPADTGYYAYSQSLGKIFMINKELPKELYLRLYDLREKKVISENLQENVGRIVITREGRTVDLALRDGHWQMLLPFVARAADDEMKNFVDNLAQQKAEAFVPWEQKPARLPQRVALQLYGRNKQLLGEYDVFYLGTGENEGILVHRHGDTEAARTRREFWELLQFDTSDLLERRLFPGEAAGITRISVVADSEKFVIEQQGKRWLKNGKNIDIDKLPPLLDTLRNWKGLRLVRGEKNSIKNNAIIEVTDNTGVTRLEVSDTSMNRELSPLLPVVDTEHAGSAVQYWLATSSALADRTVVGSHEIKRLLDQVRNLQ